MNRFLFLRLLELVPTAGLLCLVAVTAPFWVTWLCVCWFRQRNAALREAKA